jgi:hypothetical protein
MKHAKNITLALAAFLTAPLAGLGAEQGKPVSVSETVRAFVSERCMDCHDDATSKGDVSLESLGDSVTDATAIGWLRALEQIERGTMPPPDKKQPTDDERQAAVLALESNLASFSESKPVRETAVLRRLNRTEYRRTLEDLLHLDLSRRDPTTEFPDDNRSHGFASDGAKLVTSSYLMRHYLTAAKDVVGRAVHFEPQPETRTWSLSAPFEKTAGGHRHSATAACRSRSCAMAWRWRAGIPSACSPRRSSVTRTWTRRRCSAAPRSSTRVSRIGWR